MTLYPATLLNCSITSNTLGMDSFGFSIQSIMSSAKRQFDDFFADLDTFYSFCCLIAVARTSSTMLNNNGERGHPCHVPDLKRRASSFSPLRIIFAVGFS